MQTHAAGYFAEVAAIAQAIDTDQVEALAAELVDLRARGGRLFLLGVGGSAANCAHAVNDFRKLCGIEAYSATDNVAELTARTNDEGWETVFTGWLAVSRARAGDALFILSVGGGDAERGISTNLVRAIDAGKERGLRILGIVGRATGHAARSGDAVIVVPTVNAARITPHSEAFQTVIWHGLVCHPALQIVETKWEAAVPAVSRAEERAA